MPVASRTRVLYVSIDNYDRCAPGEWGHGPNVARLDAVARSWGAARGVELAVETAFFRDVTAATLEDPRLFALWLAGSWPEWLEQGRGMGKEHEEAETYGDALAPFARLVRESTVPTIAVCGSHHLVAAAYAGTWKAVGHMLADPAHPTIDDELRDGASYIPVPRVGEIGAFAMEYTAEGREDPIFRGMGAGPLYFIEHHHDEVVEAHRSSAFVSLLRPADAPAIQDTATRPGHRAVEVPRESCRVQALRHAEKLLYTFQFHPELSARVVAPELDPVALAAHRAAYDTADANGEKLLMNFFDLAAGRWNERNERSES